MNIKEKIENCFFYTWIISAFMWSLYWINNSESFNEEHYFLITIYLIIFAVRSSNNRRTKN